MATTSSAILCAAVALLLWLPVGWLIARRLPLGPDLRLAAAPLLGWAGQGIVTLQVSMVSGLSAALIVTATVLLCLLARAGAASAVEPLPPDMPTHRLPLWAMAAAALLAVAPALAVLPKAVPEGIALAPAIYDHAKIALIDEIVRTGVPPANPFLGQPDGPGGVAYYYFWLYGAAQLALLSGRHGWEADIAATWFSAFASLSLMCGIAFRLSGGRPASLLFVLIAALGGSLRPVVTALLGERCTDAVLKPATGLGGWLFQVSWSPHHVMAAAAVVLAILVMGQLARKPTTAGVLTLAILVAAAFESSLWVGGVAFALSAAAAGLVLLAGIPSARRGRFVLAVAAAAVIVLAIVLPLLRLQIGVAATRGNAMPIMLAFYQVLGPAISRHISWLLNPLAYWLVLIPLEFPVAAMLGALGAWRLTDALVRPLAAAALASLAAGGLLMSTVGENNNDLGWRAVLPGLMVLTAFAAAVFSNALARRRKAVAMAGIVLLGLALPDGFDLLRGNAVGETSVDAGRFRDAPALWAAVRQHSGPDERVASDPRMTGSLVPWPITLSWALLANRRSCFAGNELALAFTSLSPNARNVASDLFVRVFDGVASEADLEAVIRDYDCSVIVLTPESEAWRRDPFAGNPRFTLAAIDGARWRIYRANRAPRNPGSGRAVE